MGGRISSTECAYISISYPRRMLAYPMFPVPFPWISPPIPPSAPAIYGYICPCAPSAAAAAAALDCSSPPLGLRHLRSVNVIEGEPNDRQMTTGNHTVRDIYCVKCGQTLGWKYVRFSIHP